MPTDPQTWVDLSVLFSKLNMQLLTAVAVLTFILYRIRAVPDRFADLVPFVLGALCGLRTGVEAGYSIAGYSIAGATINGAAAWVLARVASVALQKLVELTQWRRDG